MKEPTKIEIDYPTEECPAVQFFSAISKLGKAFMSSGLTKQDVSMILNLYVSLNR